MLFRSQAESLRSYSGSFHNIFSVIFSPNFPGQAVARQEHVTLDSRKNSRLLRVSTFFKPGLPHNLRGTWQQCPVAAAVRVEIVAIGAIAITFAAASAHSDVGTGGALLRHGTDGLDFRLDIGEYLIQTVRVQITQYLPMAAQTTTVPSDLTVRIPFANRQRALEERPVRRKSRCPFFS